MEPWHILGAVIVICALLASPWLKPYLARPGMAGAEFCVIFAVLAIGLGLFLWISLSLPLAFTIAIIRYESRTRVPLADSEEGAKAVARQIESQVSDDEPAKKE